MFQFGHQSFNKNNISFAKIRIISYSVMMLKRVVVFVSVFIAIKAMANNYQFVPKACRCGINAECKVVKNRQVCSCPSGYYGDPSVKCIYGECESDSECSNNQICSEDYTCVPACKKDTCGLNAECISRNHIAVCSCPSDFTGNPRREYPVCEGQCGKNAVCRIRNSIIFCHCPLGYKGNARVECKPECEMNDDCPSHKSVCENNLCTDLCDKCGKNAVCSVENGTLNCSCPLRYIGNPYRKCDPQCVTDKDCDLDGTGNVQCFNSICVDLCDGVCGVNANCRLIGFRPVCSCPKNMTGDPFTRCRPFELSDLCDPNPCGLRAQCKPGYDSNGNDRPVCTCPTGYYGNSLVECKRGECLVDTECPATHACIDFRCEEVCIPGVCGFDTRCIAHAHSAVCKRPETAVRNSKYKSI